MRMVVGLRGLVNLRARDLWVAQKESELIQARDAVND